MKRTTILGICITAFVAIAAWVPNVLAYEIANSSSACISCHSFPGTTHDFHRRDMSIGCSVCHVSGGSYSDPIPVVSTCATCHDPAPLQDRHINNYGASCGDCHNPTPPPSPPPSTCIDKDGDGYGNPGDASCNSGSSANDCNDSDAAINPNAVEDCTDGIDNNCNGLVDTQDPNAQNCPLNCSDSDGDTYSPDGGLCGQVDCDDSYANVNPGAFESCSDGLDNDCNGQIDCDDKACTGDPACLAEFCSDYSDRVSCKADPRCNWSGKLKSCEDITEQLECQQSGGRWSKRQKGCNYR